MGGAARLTRAVIRMCSLRAEGEDAAQHREPQEQQRGEFVGPDQRVVEDVAGDDADEEDDDLGDDQKRGADLQHCIERPI